MDPFSKDLMQWYAKHQRTHLPWRNHPSPYRTWVSEVMLQQTRVETVIPYFDRFMAKYPNVEDLAGAPQDDVLSLWTGLGYYSRARNLHQAAKKIVELGFFPNTTKGLRELPGVGEYMSGAIASIALGLDEPAVDGNVVRVLSRIHRHAGTPKAIRGFALQHLPPGRAGDFNQALMDLGSRVCLPKRPRCVECPVAVHCEARMRADVELFPPPKKKKAIPLRTALAGVLCEDKGILLAKRPSPGLFAGLYEVPGVLLAKVPKGRGLQTQAFPAEVCRTYAEELGLNVNAGAKLGVIEHQLTHMRIELHLFRVSMEGRSDPRVLGTYTAFSWFNSSSAISEVGVSSLTNKALKLLGPTYSPSL